MKIIKKLENLKITGWEDKQELGDFYTKMMTEEKKPRKKKLNVKSKSKLGLNKKMKEA